MLVRTRWKTTSNHSAIKVTYYTRMVIVMFDPSTVGRDNPAKVQTRAIPGTPACARSITTPPLGFKSNKLQASDGTLRPFVCVTACLLCHISLQDPQQYPITSRTNDNSALSPIGETSIKLRLFQIQSIRFHVVHPRVDRSVPSQAKKLFQCGAST